MFKLIGIIENKGVLLFAVQDTSDFKIDVVEEPMIMSFLKVGLKIGGINPLPDLSDFEYNDDYFIPMSNDSSDSEDSEITLIDRLGEHENSFVNIEYKDFVDKFVGKLNELEVKIFKGRFFEEKTQSSLAKELDISQMTISRIERKIVEKLRKEYEK